MKSILRASLISMSLLAAVTSLPTVADSAPSYHVAKEVSLGAPDRWDYLTYDVETHHLYVAHGDKVTVVDTAAGAVVGNVEGFPGGTHGIGISHKFNKGYSDDGKAGTVQSFDLGSLKTIKTIKAREDADGIVVDPVTGHVFVINGDSGNITVIDPATDTATATIEAGEKLEFGVAGQDGKVFVDGAEKKEILRIDTKTNSIDARWSISGCTSPHGIAIDAATHRVFASCVNSVMVAVNADSGAVVATVPIGKGTDAAAFDPKRKLVFSSNGTEGTLSVILEKDSQTFVPMATVKTAVTGRTMAVDPETGRLFVAAADVVPNEVGTNGRPKLVPGSLKLLFLDPDN